MDSKPPVLKRMLEKLHSLTHRKTSAKFIESELSSRFGDLHAQPTTARPNFQSPEFTNISSEFFDDPSPPTPPEVSQGITHAQLRSTTGYDSVTSFGSAGSSLSCGQSSIDYEGWFTHEMEDYQIFKGTKGFTTDSEGDLVDTPFDSSDRISDIGFFPPDMAHLHPTNPAPASYTSIGRFHPDPRDEWAASSDQGINPVPPEHSTFTTRIPNTHGAPLQEQHFLSPAPGSGRSVPGVFSGNFVPQAVSYSEHGNFGAPLGPSSPALGSSRSAPGVLNSGLVPWTTPYPEHNVFGTPLGSSSPLPGSSRPAPGALSGDVVARNVAYPGHGAFFPGVSESYTHALLGDQYSSSPAPGPSRSAPETSSGDPLHARHLTGIPNLYSLNPPIKDSASGSLRPAVAQTLNNTGPIRRAKLTKKKKTSSPVASAVPPRKKPSQNLRQDTLKRNLGQSAKKYDIDKVVWDHSVDGTLTMFHMFVVTSKAFFPDPAAGSIESQYAPMLREALSTELMVRGVPLEKELNPIPPKKINDEIRVMRHSMLDAIGSVARLYELDPDNIPKHTEDYKTAVKNRVAHLRSEFNYFFELGPNGYRIHPVIWEGLIEFLWFPKDGAVPLGVVFASHFDEGVPLMLAANCGSTAEFFLKSYDEVRRIFSTASHNFEARVFRKPRDNLYDFLLFLWNDTYHGPVFKVIFKNWIQDGRARYNRSMGLDV